MMCYAFTHYDNVNILCLSGAQPSKDGCHWAQFLSHEKWWPLLQPVAGRAVQWGSRCGPCLDCDRYWSPGPGRDPCRCGRRKPANTYTNTLTQAFKSVRHSKPFPAVKNCPNFLQVVMHTGWESWPLFIRPLLNRHVFQLLFHGLGADEKENKLEASL
jgi:hypothetical protein